MTQQFVLKMFLLTRFQRWGAESTPPLSPSLPRDPELLLLPKRLQAKTTPRSSPFPYLSISRSHKQVSGLFRMCTPGCQRRRLLAAPLTFRVRGCAPLTLQAPCRNRAPGCSGSWGPSGCSPGRPTAQRGTLPPGAGFVPVGSKLLAGDICLIPRALPFM